MAVVESERGLGIGPQSDRSGSYPAVLPLEVTSRPRIEVRPVSYAGAKRALDVVVALLCLGLGAPLLALIALMVRLTSPGPVLFKQTRVGLAGRQFTLYKFRSMCVNAESLREQLLHMNEVSGPVFKIKNDPRVTPVGRLLRKLSLDELPQLWNVLRGDMSLVGPRPPVPHEVAQYGARELRRLAVKPGLTCLWQVNGRSSVAFDHWVEMDLIYIDTMSFWNDLIILVKTVPAVVTGRGAQ
jgi:exopolysaccharide biosynthesis polyprenyl glycosylphosphotransferase